MTRKQLCPRKQASKSESGLALVMVVVTVALLSIIVIELAYSTNLRARGQVMVVRGLKAEYLMKSALNLARALIKADSTFTEDSKQVPWALFQYGKEIPAALLGINEPNLKLSLEIRPEEIPLHNVNTPFWRDTLSYLFKDQYIDFDGDKEEDQSEEFKGRHFSGDEVVANLIDYQDPEKPATAYSSPDFDAQGYEGGGADDISKNSFIESLQELLRVPGFTAARVRKIMPYVSAVSVGGTNMVSINTASKKVLTAMLQAAKLSAADAADGAQHIMDFRKGPDGPYGGNMATELTNRFGAAAGGLLSRYFQTSKRVFRVIAEVDYGNSQNFMWATLFEPSQGDLPEIKELRIY